MANLNKYVGWGVSSFLMYLINKRSNSSDDSSSSPSNLNVTSNQTKIGEPIPAGLGRFLVKSPITSYFGDFRSEIYTETYAAHANFSAWPLVLSLIATYIGAAITGHSTNKGKVTTGKEKGALTEGTGNVKDFLTGPLLNSLFMWLLSWLINGRNLKTTIQKGFKYYLGYQFLVCWASPNMRIRAIYMKEEKVWEGDEAAGKHGVGPFTVNVNNDQLFGGPDEDGGFVGDMRCYLGGDNQQADGWMIKQMSADTVQQELRGLTPAYRDFVTIVVPTAYIGKSATIPETWIELQNCPNNLGLGQVGEDANPAEVLYELHVNRDWGLSEDPNLINIDSLKEIGKTLKAEGIGISVHLKSKAEALSVIEKICEHINAVKFDDPQTGKLTFKLIRNDYDVDTLLRLDTTNCSRVEYTRLDWGETISTISVSFTDRSALYEENTVPDVDPANIEINNGTQTTKTYDYTYFTKAENALWATKRELKQQAYPLAKASIEGNKKLSKLRIGSVFVLNWEPYGIKNMVMRVVDVNLGDFVEGVVKVEAIEDIFGLEKTTFGFSGSTEWQKGESYPTGVQNFRYLEMPWEIYQSNDTYVSAFAARSDEKTQSWTVWREKAGSNFESTTSMAAWSAAGKLYYDVAEFGEVEDLIGFEITNLGGIDKLESSNVADVAVARKGGRLLVVDDEIMAYSTLFQLPNGHWYVKGILRGVFDTVPKKHSANSTVFFIRSSYYANVTTGGPVCRAGDTTAEAYNITTSTVDHAEEFDATKVKALTTRRRAELPSVPGRIRMRAYLQNDVIHTDEIARDLTVSWVARNKRGSFGCVSQDDLEEYWMKQPFSIENGVDYLVRVSVGDKSKDYTIAESPFSYSYEQRCSDFHNFSDKTRIEIYARKGELLSYQAQERSFDWNLHTMIDAVVSENDGINVLASWGIDARVVIPDGALSTQAQILYADLPIIVLGEKVSTSTPNSIACQDGSYVIPNGQIMIVTSKNTYELYTMQSGFAFASYFVPNATGGKIYYQWNGREINEYIMG